MIKQMVLPLQTDQATLERVGGKGSNLAKLARAGYPIPDGCLITTEAYHHYVTSNGLAERILRTVANIQPKDPVGLERASATIQNWFEQGTLVSELANPLRDAYATLGRPPVAVRSSATAEDLPEMSFAGQQDTFLNIVGEDALLQAVVQCWGSLWTARAIGYRARNKIAHDHIALAVIVQEMVQAETSGVLFTANPLTGVRTEAVIDATLGLGEALVAGRVEPDHYIVNTAKGEILSRALGAKSISVRCDKDGGVLTVQESAREIQALPDAQILQLAELGQRIAAEYDFPQDIEWAWADGHLVLLQSRPITALYPLPDSIKPEPLRVMVSFAAIQGITEPLTPLGQDAVRVLFAGGGTLFGFQETYKSQRAAHSAGERLWVDVTPLLRNTVGRRIAPRALGLVEPSVRQAIDTLWADPRLMPEKAGIRPRTLRRLARFAIPFWKNIMGTWRDPDGRRIQIQTQIEERLAAFQAESGAIEPGSNLLAEQVAMVHKLRDVFPYVVPGPFAAVIAGMIPLAILNRLASHLDLPEQERKTLPLEITRGLPHNVTTEMDLALWDVARAIMADEPSASRFQGASASDLAAAYVTAGLPHAAQEAITHFLIRYGMRGPGEIDLGRPRWCEDPTHIMQTLQSYIRIEDVDQVPDAVFRRGAQAASSASDKLASLLQATRGGWFKAKVARWASRRVRALAGLRESPKFYVMRMMGIIRQGLLASGRDLVAAGVLREPEDLFFLRLSELEALSSGESCDWAGRIAERQANHRREKMRRQIPRLLLSNGRAYYEGLRTLDSDGEEVIAGSPVSPGMVEGTVRVVLDPQTAQLNPGEILVCPGTDPAWTPLFLVAGGLVTEVGGLITHGSVVAREYGIPAVVGVHEATRRLRTGQRIHLDGNAGRIILLA